MTTIVDTNIWLMTVTDTFSLFTEANRVLDNPDLAVTQAIISELQTLCEQGEQPACTAHDLIQSKGLKIVSSTTEYADDDIIAASRANRCAVITNDKDLTQQLKAHNIPVYQPRQRSHLIKA
jgi:rRNA-processing protein FCF1